MKYETWTAPGPADPLGLMPTRKHIYLQRSTLPGADAKRKAELKAMYDNLPPGEQQMLRSIRAQRAIDSVDVFHSVLTHEWGSMTEREKALWSRVSTLTTKLQSKLKGSV